MSLSLQTRFLYLRCYTPRGSFSHPLGVLTIHFSNSFKQQVAYCYRCDHADCYNLGRVSTFTWVICGDWGDNFVSRKPTHYYALLVRRCYYSYTFFKVFLPCTTHARTSTPRCYHFQRVRHLLVAPRRKVLFYSFTMEHRTVTLCSRSQLIRCPFGYALICVSVPLFTLHC